MHYARIETIYTKSNARLGNEKRISRSEETLTLDAVHPKSYGSIVWSAGDHAGERQQRAPPGHPGRHESAADYGQSYGKWRLARILCESMLLLLLPLLYYTVPRLGIGCLNANLNYFFIAGDGRRGCSAHRAYVKNNAN